MDVCLWVASASPLESRRADATRALGGRRGRCRALSPKWRAACVIPSPITPCHSKYYLRTCSLPLLPPLCERACSTEATRAQHSTTSELSTPPRSRALFLPSPISPDFHPVRGAWLLLGRARSHSTWARVSRIHVAMLGASLLLSLLALSPPPSLDARQNHAARLDREVARMLDLHWMRRAWV
jgi:hypothetical protein